MNPRCLPCTASVDCIWKILRNCVCCLQSECAAGKHVERLKPGQAGDRADNDAPEWLRSSLGFEFSMVVLAYLKKKAEMGSGK